jgi:hypothetical protein
MRIVFRIIALCIAAISISPFAHASARQGCKTQALTHLKRLSPDGYAIYEAMRDKKLFLSWVTCDDVQLGLATAVHESVHILTQQKDAYPLIGGGQIHRPHEVSNFFPPGQIAKAFPVKDIYVMGYLRPRGASSAIDFMYLLDEMNAYSHDLKTAVALNSLRPRDRQVDHRDGLTALMAYVMTYVDTAQKKHPATWTGLQRPEPKRVIQTLWAQAERSLANSCGVPNIGTRDRYYIGRICAHDKDAGLSKILGRTPSCPSACVPAKVSSAR